MPSVIHQLQSALAERYRVGREIGRGGMATVYRAHDLRHDREVAVKVLDPDLSAALGAERFLREIKLLARLQHPHILPLYDSGEIGGLLFYVMPYVAGDSLRARLARERTLPVEDALRLTSEVASALDYAHRHGVVHRDVKPENVLLQDGHAVVADFGVARAISAAADKTLTGAGLSVGTPAYMSPEQAVGTRELDGRSDIYALGCVLYEMLAGEAPFTGPSAQAVISRRFTEGPPLVRRVRGSVPEFVERAVLRAMAPEAADRFQSAAQFTSALESRPTPNDASPVEGALPDDRVASIGVLPFSCLTADPDGDALGDGLTEELISGLATLDGVRVASRSSSFALKGRREEVRALGERLNVAAVLEGSVRKLGGRVRVSAQLTSVSDGYQLWSHSYERDGGDLFAVQDSVAGEIIAALRERLIPSGARAVERRSTADPEAAARYERARRVWSRRTAADLPRAAADLQEAIERDPSFATAHAALAAVCIARADVDLSPVDASAAAVASASRAIELDSSLGEAHAAQAFAHTLIWEWDEADAAFERAISRAPRDATVRHWHAIHLAALGRIDDACRAIAQAEEIEPDSPVLRAAGGALSCYARDWDRAEAECRRGIGLDPAAPFPHVILGIVHAARANHAEAVAELERALDLLGTMHPFPLTALGCVCAASGRVREAAEALDELRTLATRVVVSPFHVAALHAALGNSGDALGALDDALEARDGWLLSLRVHPWMDPLRRDPRFADVLKRMGHH
jgi:serine/threonine-protein kinase